MPSKPRLQSLAKLAEIKTSRPAFVCSSCRHASTATATAGATTTTPASTEAQMSHDTAYSNSYSTIQPPSYRDPKYRRSQLLRSYVSLLQKTPLIILFQHNNLKALEWAGIRRELARALQKVDDQLQARGVSSEEMLADSIKLQVVQTNMLEPALRITEFYRPSSLQENSSASGTMEDEKLDPSLTHALSKSAYISAQANRNTHPLTPVLSGNIALVNFPSVSPQHVKAALSILSPKAPTFPAPTRKSIPSYYEPAVQDGLKKLMLLGGRIDGETFDMEGVRWVGSIDGGITGLRAQLVNMLQGFGAGLAQTLESASRSVWFTVEGRRKMLEDEQNPQQEGEQQKV